MNARPYLREVSLKRDGIEDADAYPFDIPAVRKLDRLQFHRDVTAAGNRLSAPSPGQVAEPSEGRLLSARRWPTDHRRLWRALAARAVTRRVLPGAHAASLARSRPLHPGRARAGAVADAQEESQFIVATHSPILMAYPGARILLLDTEGFRAVR